MINILFIAIMIPFTLAFKVRMTPAVIALELISLVVSYIFVVINLRIPVNFHGRQSLKFPIVLKNYWSEGMMIDLFGLLPLNLILGILYPTDEIESIKIIVLICLLRLTRVFCIFRGLDLIE